MSTQATSGSAQKRDDQVVLTPPEQAKYEGIMGIYREEAQKPTKGEVPDFSKVFRELGCKSGPSSAEFMASMDAEGVSDEMRYALSGIFLQTNYMAILAGQGEQHLREYITYSQTLNSAPEGSPLRSLGDYADRQLRELEASAAQADVAVEGQPLQAEATSTMTVEERAKKIKVLEIYGEGVESGDFRRLFKELGCDSSGDAKKFVEEMISQGLSPDAIRSFSGIFLNAHMMAYRQDSRQEHLTQMGSVASYLVRHGDDRVKALGLQGLSAYYYYSSDYNNAETSAESAVDLITKMGGGDSKSWEVAKNNLAMAKRAQGDTQGSVKEFEDIVNTRGTNMGVVTAMNAASTFNSYGVEKYVQLAIILSEHAMKKAQEEMLSPKTKKSLEGLYSQLHEGQKKDAPEGGGTNTTEDPTIEAESGLENVAVTDDKIRRETGDSPEAAAEAAPTQAEGTADGAEVKDVAPAPPNTDVQPHPKVESQPGGTVITPPKEETAQTNTGEVTSRPEDAPTTAAPAVVEKLEPIKFYSSLAEVELKPEDYAKRGGNDMATRIDVQFEVRWMDDDMGHAISQRDIRLKRTCMRLIKGASLDDLLRINKAITELREIMKPPEGEDVQSTEGQQAKASRSALALAAFRSFIYGSTQGDTHAADAASAAPVETQDEKLTTSDLNALLNGELPYKKQGTVAGAIHKLGWRGDKRITDDANALVKGNLTVESAGELHELLDRMMIAMVGVMSIRQTAWHNEFEDAANRILNKFSQNPEAAQTTKDEIDQKRTMIAEIARRTHLEEEQLVVDRVNPGENPSMEKLAIELIRAQE